MRSLLHPVGQKRPNTFDIYDMMGNVCECVGYWYSRRYYEERPRSNPSSPSRGGNQVYCGGSYRDKAEDLRTVKREKKSNRRGDQTIGFRLVF